MPAGALLVTARDGLAASVVRLAALAGVSCERELESAHVRASWRHASVVVVGADLAASLAAAGLPRRNRVLVVADGPPDAGCWQAALALGAHRVAVLPDEESDLVEELRASDGQGGGSGRVVAVLGACGGAGASTFAAALAIAACATDAALLIDGDPLGGGLDVLLGAESAAGLRWADLAPTRGRLDPASFAAALCRVGKLAVLPWGRGPAPTIDDTVVEAVVAAARHAFGTVVLDVPRSREIAESRLLDLADATVLLVPAEVRAVAAASSLISALGRRLVSPQLVVRDIANGSLSARDVGGCLGLGVSATLPSDPGVRRAARRGEPPLRRSRGGLARVCATVLAGTPVLPGAA